MLTPFIVAHMSMLFRTDHLHWRINEGSIPGEDYSPSLGSYYSSVVLPGMGVSGGFPPPTLVHQPLSVFRSYLGSHAVKLHRRRVDGLYLLNHKEGLIGLFEI